MSHRAQIIGLAFAIALAVGAWLSTTLKVESDFAAFLPRGATERQRALIDQLRDGPAARLIIAAVAGGTTDERVATSRALAGALAARPEFAYVNNGSLDLAQKELDALASHRYALSPAMAPAKFSEDGLRQAFSDGLVALQGSFALLEKQLLFRDPTGETLALMKRAARDAGIRREQGVFVDAAGEQALLLLQTRAGGADLEGQSAALAALDEAFRAHATPGQSIVASSPGTMAVQSREVVKRDAGRVSLMSAAGVLVVLLVAYRSIPVVAISFVPAALGLLVGVTAVQMAFGYVHAITFAFGATLLGEAVDYPSYLLTSDRSTVGRAMALAVATTACGSLALLMSGFEGLMQLGLLTAVGIVAAGAAAWWLVPSLVPAGWTFRPPRWGHPEARWRVRGSVAIGAFAVLTIASLAVLVARPPWDDDPARLNPLPASLALQDRTLREAVGAPDARFFALVRAPTLEAALARTEALAAPLSDAVAQAKLGGYALVTDDLPSEATQRRRLSMLPDADALRARVAAAQQGLPFRPEAFARFVDEAARARSAAPVKAADWDGTAIGLRVQSLIAQAPGEVRITIPLTGVADADGLRRSLTGDGVELVDLRAEVGSLFGAFRERAMLAIGLGIGLIYAILAIGLRDAARAARVLAPAVMAALWTLGALSAFGQALTLFHLIAALLVVGVGVNYMLFAVPAKGETVSGTAVVSLAVVSATTLCAFGAMATSSIPVLDAIGTTVTLGVVATLLACALLVGTLRSA